MAAESYDVNVMTNAKRVIHLKINREAFQDMIEKDIKATFGDVSRNVIPWLAKNGTKEVMLTCVRKYTEDTKLVMDYVHILTFLTLVFEPERALQLYLDADEPFVVVQRHTGHPRKTYSVNVEPLLVEFDGPDETKLIAFQNSPTCASIFNEYFAHINADATVIRYRARIEKINRDCRKLLDEAHKSEKTKALTTAIQVERAQDYLFFLDPQAFF